LKLAEAYTAIGNLAAAENTLKTAIQAIPDDARLYLMLGELYHRQDQPTQALNVLQKAAKIENLDRDQSELPATDARDPSARYLSPLAGEIVLLLGPTLLQLGHSDRAVEVLHNAYQTKEHKQAAAHQYARALIAVGKEQQALSALSIAHQSDPENQALSIEYARLLLKLGEQSEVAVALLSKQIEAGSTDVELLALLAEALAGSADFHSALTYYQKAMETQLMGDPHWSIRLALGLSQVALETNNPNLAIAALQDAIQQAPDHLVLHQKLAEACFAAGLKEDALQLARQAYRLSPANIDNIIWYASHCQQFDHREQAYEALQEAIELFPNHIELYLKAAEIEAKTNRTEAALQHFQTAADMPEISLEQLHIAASGLLELGNAEACIRCLERVQLVIHEDYNELSHRLLILLASAYDRLGENETALELIEKALYHQPVSAALLKQKAIIHLRLHQFKAAKACLQQVAKNEPHDPEVHRLLMQTEEAEGNFSAALDHARNGLAFAPPDQFRRAVLDAARLAWSLFQDQDTAQFLASFAASPQEREPQLTSQLHRVITALIAIDGHNWALISELNQANNGHQRTAPADIAIAALDDTLHGEVANARGLLLQLMSCDNDSLPPTPLVLGLAFETALRLLDFDMALEIAQRWQSAEPHNPRAYLAELRTCTEQAERKGFLADVGVTGRWASEAWNENRLREKIDKSKAKLLSLFGYPDVDSVDLTAYTPLFPELVRRWITRSTAVFMDPSDLQPEEVKHLLQEMARLAPDPGNTAAYIAAARRLGFSTQAVRVAKEYPNQSNVLAQLALCNLNIDPSAAMAAALNAMELAVSSSEQTHLPVYHALIARAATSAENYPQAYQALSNALAEWPDEPGWHIQAAEYARLTNDMAACIQHLEKAVAIDPDSDTVRRQLARSYQDAGALSRAAETYQKLCDNHPQDIDCWLEFAELQYQRGEIDAAAAFAEKALALGTTDPETILFTAQLQYSAENYPRAQELAGRLIEVEPENSSAAYLLARSLSAANRKEAALEVLDRALRYADRPLDLYLERIRLIRALHGLQPAFQSLQALDRQHPDHPGILALLAEYEQALGMVAEALATAQRALQLGQEVFKPQEASRLHALIGRIYRRTGQLDQALHQFSLAVSLYPTRIEYYLELGKTYQDRRQIEDALKIYEDAIQIAPQDPRPYQQAGQALKECKDYLGAEKMIRQAAELSPHDISIHRLLGSLVALNLVHNS
jgi:tetratricopeptide (TPR) repeat protein